MNNPYGPSATAAETLVDLLRRQADDLPDHPAYTFWSEDGRRESLTFGQLDRRAQSLAAALQQMATADEPVLLMYPAGLDFIAGFFGCLYAGVLAVPVTYPKPRRPSARLSTVAADCGARSALSTSATLVSMQSALSTAEFSRLRWVASDTIETEWSERWQPPSLRGEDLAFLQYTSGSTTEPRGVMVSHANLLHNLEMIRQGFSLSESSIGQMGVFWLPAYHDMGLIGGILEPLYVGGHSLLMSPQAFLQRPLRWLEAISEYRAAVSGGPNFAYEFCVQKTTPEQRAQLNLSSWRVAFCGAEPIRSEVLESFAKAFAPAGFRADSFYPCYGLAEGTLLAAGGAAPHVPHILPVDRQALADNRVVVRHEAERGVQRLVGCGSALSGQQLMIVDPQTCRPCPSEEVGEIWISGPSVARGYWNRPEETRHTFHGQLYGASHRGPWLRTGDLGFLRDGHVFITGRIKDVIIIRARNYYPQDIERTVQEAHPALAAGVGSAFSIDSQGRERLVVVHEVDRRQRALDSDEVIRGIRRAVAAEHELEVSAVALARHASLPRTTSGKIQRQLCRARYLAGELKLVAVWTKEPVTAASPANGRRNGHRQPTAATTETMVSQEAGRGAATSATHPEQRAAPRALTAPEQDRLADRIEHWLLQWLRERAGVPADEIARDRPFAEYGVDSLTAVELSQELEDWLSVRLTPVIAWNYPTVAALATYLAQQAGGGSQVVPSDSGTASTRSPFEQLLTEIEALSDEEAQAALERELDE